MIVVYPKHPHGGVSNICTWCGQSWGASKHDGYTTIVVHMQALFTSTYSDLEVARLVAAAPHPQTVTNVEVSGCFDRHNITLTATAPFDIDLVLLPALASTSLVALDPLPYDNTPYGEITAIGDTFAHQRPARTPATQPGQGQRNERPPAQAWGGAL